METFPDKLQDEILLPLVIGEEKPDKITDLAAAMRRAQEMLAFERNEEFNDPDPYGYLQEIENESGTSLLDDEWKAEPDDDTWNRRIRSRARKAAIARLYLMGYTTNDIANQLEISEVTVKRDIEFVSLEWKKSYLDDIETLASRDLARLDEMFNKLSRGIERGDVKSIRAGVEIIKERGDILGYRHGVSVDITEHVRELAISHGLDEGTALEVARRVSLRYK